MGNYWRFMKTKFVWLVCIAIALAVSATAQTSAAPKPKSKPMSRTVTQLLDASVQNLEHEFVPAAEAMPEDKFSFAPANGEFKGVRTFAEQIKHVAAVNYELGAAILEEKPPVDVNGESGPASPENALRLAERASEAVEDR